MIENNSHTCIPNELINDKSLKLRDIGLYAFMMQRPNSSPFSVRWISSKTIEGRDSIARSLNNLINNGWITRTEVKTRGRYVQIDYKLMQSKK